MCTYCTSDARPRGGAMPMAQCMITYTNGYNGSMNATHYPLYGNVTMQWHMHAQSHARSRGTTVAKG